jgi:hypothetical protein
MENVSISYNRLLLVESIEELYSGCGYEKRGARY